MSTTKIVVQATEEGWLVIIPPDIPEPNLETSIFSTAGQYSWDISQEYDAEIIFN